MSVFAARDELYCCDAAVRAARNREDPLDSALGIQLHPSNGTGSKCGALAAATGVRIPRPLEHAFRADSSSRSDALER